MISWWDDDDDDVLYIVGKKEGGPANHLIANGNPTWKRQFPGRLCYQGKLRPAAVRNLIGDAGQQDETCSTPSCIDFVGILRRCGSRIITEANR